MTKKNLGAVTAYALAVKNGFEGTEAEWLASLKGDDYVLSEADKTEIAEIVSGKVASDKYFDIDCDGIISLKPEYRGDTTTTYATNYPYSKSDNGVGVEGSKIAELPERIVIPQNVDGEQVTGFQKGMFCHNRKIKEVVIPTTIKSINNGMFRDAIYLEKVENTEQIETIGAGAFAWTRVKELRFPNLKVLGNLACQSCSCLKLIDVGNITTIGKLTFEYCENLTEVLGGANVTSIGEQAFFGTRRLKTLPFLANLKNIDEGAFASSRCDFDAVYNTLVANGCNFGNLATYKQFNGTDYWSGTTFTACRNSLNSLFYQKDPRWADEEISINGKTYLNDDGQPCTYRKNGCAFIVLAEIYSAFEKVNFESPEDFLEILESKGLVDPENMNYRIREGWCAIANGLGYETTHIKTMTKEDLQEIYNALSKGALIYKSTLKKSDITGGHAMLAYGINTDGEMLTSDSSMHCNEVGIYENHKTAWHIYKHCSIEGDAVIVKKP